MNTFQVRAFFADGTKVTFRRVVYMIPAVREDEAMVLTVKDRDSNSTHSVWVHGVVMFFVDSWDV